MKMVSKDPGKHLQFIKKIKILHVLVSTSIKFLFHRELELIELRKV